MGGPCAVQVYAPDAGQARRAMQAAQVEVLRIETKYSRYRADSVVSRINAAAGAGKGIEVDEETAALLDYAAAAYEQSDGLFDITSGVLRRAWDFKAKRLPSDAQLAALLPLVGWSQVEWQRPRVRLSRAGMEIDFGGFGKEYAADRAAAVLLALGVKHGLVELGGDIRIVGPHPDGSPWRIGVRHPRRPAEPIATLELHQGAIASSGDYERFFEHGGKRYCHILDPRSGWPVQSFAGVSVLAEQCLIAGTATTVGILRGEKDGAKWLKELGLPHLCIGADLRVGGTLAVH